MTSLFAKLIADERGFAAAERVMLSGWIAMFVVAILQNFAPWAAR